jgi:rRNA maturation protein Nop10
MEHCQDLDCPLCNGLIDVKGKCPQCGSPLEDGGTVEAYYEPYSPYEEVEEGLVRCLHLLYCPGCGWDKRQAIPKIPIE